METTRTNRGKKGGIPSVEYKLVPLRLTEWTLNRIPVISVLALIFY
jgi:hypothetical protein